jgi:hypothetical protein
MGKTRRRERLELHRKFWFKNLKERENFSDLDINVWIKLMLRLKSRLRDAGLD